MVRQRQKQRLARSDAEIMHDILEACKDDWILKSHMYNRVDFGGGVGNRYVAAMVALGFLDCDEKPRGKNAPEQLLKTSEKGLMGLVRLKIAVDEVVVPVREQIRSNRKS